MNDLENAQAALAEAVTQRHRIEAAIEEVWDDAVRSSFCRRVLDPLDLETGRADAAMRELGEELVRALEIMT